MRGRCGLVSMGVGVGVDRGVPVGAIVGGMVVVGLGAYGEGAVDAAVGMGFWKLVAGYGHRGCDRDAGADQVVSVDGVEGDVVADGDVGVEEHVVPIVGVVADGMAMWIGGLEVRGCFESMWSRCRVL